VLPLASSGESVAKAHDLTPSTNQAENPDTNDELGCARNASMIVRLFVGSRPVVEHSRE
jgi:hypothetical protein